MPKNIADQLILAAEVLQKSGIAEPRREAASLLVFALQKDKTFLIAHPEYEISTAEEKRFEYFLQRRAGREPFQYITENQEFYGLDFLVTPDVLIPRPETEAIVENAVDILSAKDSPEFCEVGIGSGCVSVSILHAVETARAVGLDISEKALRIAGQNAERHKVLDRLKLEISDVFEKLTDENFDLIVSNPPYISSEDFNTLQREVRDFEPHFALTDSGNGLTIIEKIIKNAPKFLQPDSFLLMEIGFNQAREVRKMFPPQMWESVEILPDLQGILRTVKAKTSM